MTRQIYPDLLRAVSIGRIILFHFVGWQVLTYFPSLGIMFALGGLFMALSLKERPMGSVIFHRLARLLPTWWAFAVFTLIGGFFYAQGAGIKLQPSFAWLFPYELVSWKLDNDYANDATVVTWYIAAYMWLMLLSPLLLEVYKKLKWVAVFAPLFAMLAYSHTSQPLQVTLLGETAFSVLTFGGCWMLGFAKADGALDALPRYLVYLTAAVLSACGIFLTYEAHSLGSNQVAQSLMSFGVAMLLLSFNPDLSFLPRVFKSVIRTINTFAVTIYLFHNILIDASYKAGSYLNVYEIGNRIGVYTRTGDIGNAVCFLILILMIYAATKTVGVVETHNWFSTRKKVAQ